MAEDDYVLQYYNLTIKAFIFITDHIIMIIVMTNIMTNIMILTIIRINIAGDVKWVNVKTSYHIVTLQ